ncbi:hypothetical protein LOK49_LG02G04061 [Camellia lanceoleosa]|uniref:Uncharacterized protein n=1 Tax=Camellia lanceoleosa TaxID=1840588 RepID=A0ACC0IJT0_9ERIC|nr:hypothetical protein LOK49_LG02G04061 [Camellia lanceoleosa]
MDFALTHVLLIMELVSMPAANFGKSDSIRSTHGLRIKMETALEVVCETENTGDILGGYVLLHCSLSPPLPFYSHAGVFARAELSWSVSRPGLVVLAGIFQGYKCSEKLDPLNFLLLVTATNPFLCFFKMFG